MAATLTAPAPAAAALPSYSLSLSSSSSSLHNSPSSITSFPILVLTVLGILAASFLLLAYYVFVIRCCLTWHHDRGGGASSSSDAAAAHTVSRRGRRPQRTTSSSSAAPATDADEPRGLDDAAIRALPAFSYRKKKPGATGNAAATDCAVCLGEFEEGDRVRMLPACLHVFHLACVDAWLHANTTCPLCRARADVAAAATLCRLLPTPPPPQEEVAIQVVVVVPGAEEDGQDTPTQTPRQREAPVQFAGEDHAATEHEHPGVGADKTNSTVDACHGITERRKDGDGVLVPPPPRRSFSSMDGGDSMAAAGGGGGGGEVHLHIQSILQRDNHSHRDHHDSDNSNSARV